MAGVVPPWGVDDGNAGLRNERGAPGGGGVRFVPGRAGAAGDVVSSALELRQASILSERNILLDELIQVKKELQVAQLETRRMSEAFVQRLGVVESRIMAGEANARTLDKREATAQQAFAQARSEMELKMREMVAEVARFKQTLETEVRGQMDVIKGELKQRDNAMLQVEAQAREWVRHSRNTDEQRVKMENELKASIEKRLLVMQDATRKMETSNIDRIASLERLLQKEADERVKGDEEARRDFEESVNILRKASEREELAVQKMQEDLRAELDTVVQGTQASLSAFREEAERGRARLEDGLEEERSQRTDGIEDLKRKLDTFVKLYEVERVRLRDATRNALEQMTERTKAVQEVSKSMQQEGVRIKNAAARVEQEAMGGLKALTEKVEDGFHVLRAVQDRHALQIQDNRQAGSSALQDLRDKVQQAQARVQAELDKNFQEDRQMRQDLTKRIDDCEEAGVKGERRLSKAHQELEDNVRRTLESVGKDVETLRFRTTTSLTDVEGQTHELKQRVHSVEVLSEQRFAGHADDIRDAHTKMWDEILHLKSNARGMAAVEQELRVTSNLQLQKLAAVVKRLGGSLLAFEKGANVAGPVQDIGKETENIEQDLLKDAKHIHDMQSRSRGLPDGAAEQEAMRLRAKQTASSSADHEMDLSVDLAGQQRGDEDEGGVNKREGLSSTGEAFANQLVDDAVLDGMGQAFDLLGTVGEDAEAGVDGDEAAVGGGEEAGDGDYEEDEFDDAEDETQHATADGEEGASGEGQSTPAESQAEHAAATAIQRRARGMQARRHVALRRDADGGGGESNIDAEISGEAAADESDQAEALDAGDEAESERRHAAAVKIQSRARGAAARKGVLPAGSVEEDAVEAGMEGRGLDESLEAADEDEARRRHDAAVKIQSRARGAAARKGRPGPAPAASVGSGLLAHESIESASPAGEEGLPGPGGEEGIADVDVGEQEEEPEAVDGGAEHEDAGHDGARASAPRDGAGGASDGKPSDAMPASESLPADARAEAGAETGVEEDEDSGDDDVKPPTPPLPLPGNLPEAPPGGGGAAQPEPAPEEEDLDESLGAAELLP